MPKKIVFNPRFLKEVEIREKEDVEKRSVTARRNISLYHCYLYRALFGGKICAPFKTDSERMSNGDDRIFHPDIIRKGKNKTYIEVKSNSTHTSMPFCSISQLENYCHHLLRDLNKGNNSMVEYAFFRYKYSYPENQIKLDALSNHRIKMELSKRTKNLLIVPLNLLFLMLLNSKSNRPYRTHTTEQNYFMIPGKIIVDLTKGKAPIKELVQRTYDDSLEERLLLNQLDCDMYTPEAKLYCGKHPVNKFTITHYHNKDPKAWSDYFKENHKFILTKLMRIKDIYQECKDVPF